MKNQTIKISKELPLPADIVTQKLAWLGTTGSGKTYGASKLAEEMREIGAQFVVLDPVGVWYGLRLAKDGKKPSHISIPIFGGLHGDVPLEPTAGELIANLVVDKNLSCIIDASQFESDADKARFASAFASRLYFRKKSAPSAIHLFIEECQEFVPQNPQRGEEKMLHEFVRMQKLGRNFGIGSSYITQRPQEVNKKALNMAQNLFVFRTTGTHERKAIELWIKDKDLDENIANDLPKIGTGSCHIWSPEFLKVSKMIRISEKVTFNASATPEVGATAKSRELAPIDLEKVRSEMLATIEKAKNDDPKELRKRIAELERSKNPSQKGAIDQASIDKAVAIEGQRKEKEFFVERNDLVKRTRELNASLDQIFKIASKHCVQITGSTEPIKITKEISKDISSGRTITIPPKFFKELDVSESVLTQGERIVLNAIAQYEEGISMEHLAILTGYKSTSRATYTQKLAQKGYIVKNPDLLVATLEGVEALGDSFQRLPQGPELRQYLLSTLPEGEKRVFEAIINGADTKQAIMDATEYKATSVSTYAQKLGARKAVVNDRGIITINPNLE